MKKNYLGRLNDLRERLNKHLKALTGLDKDYFSKLKQYDLLELKTVLSDLNNILTFRTTISASSWICKYFQFNNSFKNEILRKVDNIKPNTNGFDIYISNPIKIAAEVKCIAPINNGNKYGAAQWNAILEDAIKLKKGKRKMHQSTKGYFKFLFLIDIKDRTDKAISHLLKKSKGTSDKSLRVDRHKIKEHILLFTKATKRNNLKLDKVYIKTIKF
jgi:hypothetical protein